MSGARTPIYRLTIHAEKYPSTLGTDVLISSVEDQADTAFSEGRVVAFDPIERGISDPSGEHFLAQATVRHDDQDHFWRARGASDATRFIDGRDATLDVVSRDALTLGGIRTTLLRGKVRSLDPEDGLGASLVIEELIGSEFGPAFLDKLLNPRKFRREFAPKIAKDLLEQHIPLVVGENSDIGRLNPDGTSATKGVCPGFDIGDFTIGASVAVGSGPVIPPPINFRCTNPGSLPLTETHTFAVTALVTGGETTLSNIITVTVPSANAIVVNGGAGGPSFAWDPPGSACDDEIIAFRVYAAPAGQTPRYKMDTLNNGGTYVDPETTYTSDGDSYTKVGVSPPSANTAYCDSATEGAGTYGLIVFADAACKAALGYYGSDGAVDGDPKRVAWTMGGMIDVLDPSSPAWPHANPYIDLVGTDGITERVYGIYVKGTRLLHHREGRVTIAANLCGRPEDANDPAGSATIDQFARVWQHLLSEQVWGNGGKGYYNGPWTGLPTFADGTEAISSPSVQAAEALSMVLLGTAKGYLTGFCLTTPMTVREFIRKFNRTYTSWTYTNEEGQLSLALINTAADPAVGTPIREDVDEVARIAAPKDKREWVENRVTGRFDWDADAQRWASDPLTFNSPQSQEALGSGGRTVVRARDEIEGFFTRDVATFNCAMGQRLLLFDRAPRLVNAYLGTTGQNIRLMGQVIVTAHEGYGADGYVEQPMLVIRRTDVPGDEATVMLQLWDMGDILSRSFGVLTAGVYTWGDGDVVWGDGEQNWAA